MKFSNLYKKALASLMITSMLVTFVPQRAEAQFLSLDMSNLAANLPQLIKEFALDTASYAASRIISAQLINRITNFINQGFESGNSFYVENQNRFMDSVQNIPLVQMTAELENWESSMSDLGLSDGYMANMRASIERNAQVIGAKRTPTTLTEKLQPDYNVENFEEDITNGGWDAWTSYIENNNNPLGRQQIVIRDYAAKASNHVKNTEKELAESGGYLADKNCDGVDEIAKLGSSAGSKLEKTFEKKNNDPLGNTSVETLQQQIDQLQQSQDNLDESDPMYSSNEDQLQQLQQQLNQAQNKEDRRTRGQDVVVGAVEDSGKLAASIGASLFGMSDCPGMENVQTPGAIIGQQIENAITSPLRQQEDVSEISQIVGGAIASYGNNLIDKGLASLRSSESGGAPGIAPLPSVPDEDSGGDVDWLSAPYLAVDIEKELPEALAKVGTMTAYLEKTLEIYEDFPLYLYTLDQCVPGPQFNWQNRMRTIFDWLIDAEEERIRQWDDAPKDWSNAFKQKAQQMEGYLEGAIRTTKDRMNNPEFQILGAKATRDAQTLLNRTMVYGKRNSDKQDERLEMTDLYSRLHNVKIGLTGDNGEGEWKWNTALEESSNELVGEWIPATDWPTKEQWADIFTDGIDPTTGLLIHTKHFPNVANHPSEGDWVDPRQTPTIANCCGKNSNPDALVPDDPGYYLTETDDNWYEPIRLGQPDSNGIIHDIYQNPDGTRDPDKGKANRLSSEQVVEDVAKKQRLIEQFASYSQEIPVVNVIATARTEARDALNSLDEIALATNECANFRVLAGWPDQRPEIMKRGIQFPSPVASGGTWTSRAGTDVLEKIYAGDKNISIGYFSFELEGVSGASKNLDIIFEPHNNSTPPEDVFEYVGVAYEGNIVGGKEMGIDGSFIDKFPPNERELARLIDRWYHGESISDLKDLNNSNLPNPPALHQMLLWMQSLMNNITYDNTDLYYTTNKSEITAMRGLSQTFSLMSNEKDEMNRILISLFVLELYDEYKSTATSSYKTMSNSKVPAALEATAQDIFDDWVNGTPLTSNRRIQLQRSTHSTIYNYLTDLEQAIDNAKPEWIAGDRNRNNITDYRISLTKDDHVLVYPKNSVHTIDIIVSLRDGIPQIGANSPEDWSIWPSRLVIANADDANADDRAIVTNTNTGKSYEIAHRSQGSNNHSGWINNAALHPWPKLEWGGSDNFVSSSISNFQDLNSIAKASFNPFKPFASAKEARDRASKALPSITGIRAFINAIQDRRLPWANDVESILARDAYNVLFCGYMDNPAWELSWYKIYTLPNGEVYTTTEKKERKQSETDTFVWGGLPPCLLDGTFAYGQNNYTDTVGISSWYDGHPGALWHKTITNSFGNNQWYNASLGDYERAFNQLNPANQIR